MNTAILHLDSAQRRINERAQQIYDKQVDRARRQMDRLMLLLMLLQWIAGVAATLWISPHTWIGSISQPHVHLAASIVLGGMISALPALFVWRMPGKPITRHTIAVSQMLWSALLIHLSGGRIETHFHVFGSLAFLAFYRDWKVLITA